MSNFSEEKKHEQREQVLSLDKRQLSQVIAILLLIDVFIFIGGYFWGQHTAIDQVLNTIERDSFADQIYYSMCSLYDQKEDESNGPDAVSGDEEEVVATYAPDLTMTATPAIDEVDHITYMAQLIGFGTAKPAEQLARRLKQKDITVQVIQRQSKTSRGKIIPWYQVVTPEFTNKDELLAVVEKIKKHEKLHDIRIIES